MNRKFAVYHLQRGVSGEKIEAAFRKGCYKELSKETGFDESVLEKLASRWGLKKGEQPVEFKEVLKLK